MVKSAASEVDIARHALDDHPGVKRYFDQANQNDPEQSLEMDQAEERGSQMVEQDRPEPELKPDPELAADQDRESFNDKWASEQDDARQAMMERYERQIDQGDRGQDQENSL